MIAVRHAVSDDLDFIIHSFLLGFWGSPAVRGMDRDAYFVMMRPRFKAALANQHTQVLVACAEDDPNTLLGWVAFHGDTLLWAYVRKPMRGTGCFRSMIHGHNLTGYALVGMGSTPPKTMEFRPYVAWSLLG